jgi:hypothetical protein
VIVKQLDYLEGHFNCLVPLMLELAVIEEQPSLLEERSYCLQLLVLELVAMK